MLLICRGDGMSSAAGESFTAQRADVSDTCTLLSTSSWGHAVTSFAKEEVSPLLGFSEGEVVCRGCQRLWMWSLWRLMGTGWKLAWLVWTGNSDAPRAQPVLVSDGRVLKSKWETQVQNSQLLRAAPRTGGLWGCLSYSWSNLLQYVCCNLWKKIIILSNGRKELLLLESIK